eukprot:369695-Rhodomonas_salina.2
MHYLSTADSVPRTPSVPPIPYHTLPPHRKNPSVPSSSSVPPTPYHISLPQYHNSLPQYRQFRTSSTASSVPSASTERGPYQPRLAHAFPLSQLPRSRE